MRINRGLLGWGLFFIVVGSVPLAVQSGLIDEDVVRRAWQLIVGSGGRRRIGQVAADVGWSRRHLTARLRSETGFGAKELARLARFHRARTAIVARTGSLAGVAASCGYADQSHFTAEWREFAGCSPGQWISAAAP